MQVSEILQRYNIQPNPLKDQFFLTNEEVIVKIVDFADLNKKDTVLEIGAGLGTITKEIAQRAGRVIAFEVDKRFKPILTKLPDNIELHLENAWNYVQLGGKVPYKKAYNKVVSNLPYSFAEPFLHNLTFLNYDKVILVVPLKILKKLEHGIFGSFFKVDVLFTVGKGNFYPTPRTNSVVINLVKLPDPIQTKNLGLFLRQYIYQHEGQLVKNSIMEGLIKYHQLVYGILVTKNQARKIISDSGIDKIHLDNKPIKHDVYEIVSEKFNNNLWNKKQPLEQIK
ncbi:hypothetical protein A3A76_05485 [Candidatus Woesebacteria bacterium RIFCSPLOWO2_01_FULL_39_23]|uniref:Ribosomal RNA adenine methylase transferase N-terminal domain-containing protein n=1 Tax=Candidatus Woesebacteria bacterium RIFCSPHIGHO2_01_FULL_40_22 TaxID=1802499 RepID=A0A1F7YKV2_9BACT|nr:MAG: hypothetical protein A2141_03825 [Candidatus Woesebacteria bacterium RBG_16_40_11]OGM27907.1 MAG: hypothetical protein A2628_03410 [Candidatus Woesebacteria bacterium RIFCSPHIGHO2_01_FULL_40_22]OGM38144.1 MAG: hypothetical protein A3E41_00965 [Candidatus Woesebacteria bacterium RIFCSPHIGHO2_12_FULL_38_9]OGM61663.1 MAG: hypothetical protein A3A76_05485 [Candidatus Woesebacteria bacterium RIFCSPLOWO2_01_FULL_39_23]